MSDLETAIAEKSFSDKEMEHIILELHNMQIKLLKQTGEKFSAESIQRSLVRQYSAVDDFRNNNLNYGNVS